MPRVRPRGAASGSTSGSRLEGAAEGRSILTGYLDFSGSAKTKLKKKESKLCKEIYLLRILNIPLCSVKLLVLDSLIEKNASCDN
jgi:hypothetical protein